MSTTPLRWGALPDGRRILLPYPHAGEIWQYQKGCRCDADKAANAQAAYERRHGLSPRINRVDPAAAHRAINEMLDAGLSWTHITRLAGLDRKRVEFFARSTLTPTTEQRVLDARDRVRREGWAIGALLLPARRWSFYQDCLFARGFSRNWICSESGNWDGQKQRDKRISTRTAERVETLFLEHHEKWGPNQDRAPMAWAIGLLPSDCYDWDQPTPDLRPIPGTLRAEFVQQALDVKPAPWMIKSVETRARERDFTLDALAAVDSLGEVLRPVWATTRDRMRFIYGQWPDPRCAAAAWWEWAESRGLATEEAAEDFRAESGSREWRCAKGEHHGHLALMTWPDIQSFDDRSSVSG